MTMPLAIIAILTASVSGAPAAAPQPAPSPFIGLWKLDTGSMTIPVEARPASVTAEFADAGAGMWNTTYVITAKDGSARRMTSQEHLDGQAAPIAGDQTDADSVAMTSPQPNVLVMGLSKSGNLGSVRVYTVSPDGKEMTESATAIGADGKPVVRRFRWIR
ncbi:MAG TPA: hypothetical protein VF409_03090 [Sphingomonas sp.]